MRIKYGKKIAWQERDAWSMDAALSPIIGSGIKYFKDTITRLKEEGNGFVGIPNGIIKAKDRLSTDVEWEEGWNKWLEILDDMIYTFLGKEPEIPDDAIKMDTGKLDKNGYTECIITHPNQKAYDEYKKLEKRHEERVKRGMEYFKEYFNSLWW